MDANDDQRAEDAPLREFGIKAKLADRDGERLADAPLREFGIKAKRGERSAREALRCSAPRIWNQGKAQSYIRDSAGWMLRSANLESRQSSTSTGERFDPDAPLREFGIKAKRTEPCVSFQA